jgi:ADP-ribose pyrophosphatase
MPSEPAPEITTGSRPGYTGAFLRVRIDEVRLPSGRSTTREVVEHPGAIAVVALTGDDHLLLVRQFRHAAGRALLELPAGTRDTAESPAEIACRELIEETGHAPGHLTELFTFYPSPGYSAEQITLFRATNCHPVDHDRDADEPAHLVRVPLTDVPSLLAPGSDQIADGKTLIGLLWLVNTTW